MRRRWKLSNSSFVISDIVVDHKGIKGYLKLVIILHSRIGWRWAWKCILIKMVHIWMDKQVQGGDWIYQVAVREVLTASAMSAKGLIEMNETFSAASSLTSYSIVDLIMEDSLSSSFSMISNRTRWRVNPNSRTPPSITSVSFTRFSSSIFVNFSLHTRPAGKPLGIINKFIYRHYCSYICISIYTGMKLIKWIYKSH